MRDNSAAAAPLAFILAGALTVAAVGAIVLNTGDVANAADTEPSRTENLKGQAESLLDLLLLSPGHFEDDSNEIYPWGKTDHLLELDGQADRLQRLGLLHHASPHLDIDKFRNLKSSPFAADAVDGYVNYVEARTGFGLDAQDLDFHVRAYPTLQSVQDILDCKEVDGTNPCRDPNMKVTYIGNLKETGDEPEIHSPQCEVSPFSNSSWRFTVQVKNTGDTTTQFQGIFDFEFGNKKETRKDQTGLVPHVDPGQTVSLWVDLENQDFDCGASDTEMTVSVYDSSKKLTSSPNGEFAVVDAPFTSSSSPTTTVTQDFFVELDHMHYAVGDLAVVGYTGASKDEVLSWEVWDGTDKTGTQKASGGHTVPNAKSEQHIDVDTTGWTEGVYTVYVTHGPTGIVATQRILVENDPVEDYTSSGSTSAYDVSMEVEVEFFNELVANFCPAFHNDQDGSVLSGWADEGSADDDPALQDTFEERCGDQFAEPFRPVEIQSWDGSQGQPLDPPQQQHGDVFWDDKSILTNEVCKRLQYVKASNGECQTGNEPRLDITNTLVLGSNVDHNAMTSGGFKWPLRDWVEAGGTLIVFGSPEKTTQWLQPIFNVGEQSSSGGVTAPDLNHPILSVPDQLSFDEYDNQGKGWRYTGGAEEHFTNVTKQGDDPVTAISDPGAFGEGTVIITTWLPYDLFGDGPGAADEEGLQMVNNFLMQGYRDLFLDYGPEIPQGMQVIPAFKRAQVDHEDIGLVDLNIALYVFPER